MEAIIAAFISAVGSIVAALIQRASRGGVAVRPTSKGNSRRWWIYAIVVVPALGVGALVSWDIAEFGPIAIGLTSVAVAFWAPVSPWTGVAFVLGLHPIALLLVAIAAEVHQVFHVYWESTIVVHLAVAAVNASIVAALCRTRLRGVSSHSAIG